MNSGPARKPHGRGTRLIQAGADPMGHGGAATPPPTRASTILIERAEDIYRDDKRTYGIEGLDAHDALRAALCELEDAEQALLVPSGLCACVLPILTFAEPGAHILVVDNVYGPTRRYCDETAARCGVGVEYFAPDIDADSLSSLIRPETRLIHLESPGSLTFEMSDARAFAAAARARGVITVFDNTWGTGLFFRPLEHGVDICIQATTKYPAGCSDVISGALMTRDPHLADSLGRSARNLGLHVSPDDAWLILRGLRSMSSRLERHQSVALELARWLQARPEVRSILFPALPGDRFHQLWGRDYSGTAGLFAFVAATRKKARVNAFLNRLRLFGLGFSWGGFHSLAIPCDPQLRARALDTDYGGAVIRLNIGLEDGDDLKADLDQALPALGM